MSTDKKTYMSNGRVLQAPPLTVRINRFFEDVYLFIGLYLVSFFSFDPYKAAQYSRFNVAQPGNKPNTRPRWGGGSGGGSGYGGGGGGGPSGGGGAGGGWPKKVGRVDDIRAPECGSCQ